MNRSPLFRILSLSLVLASLAGGRHGFAADTLEASSFTPAPVIPLPSQPPASLVVDAPLPEQLAKGYVVIRYRADNLRILPVFGPAAVAVSPRIGHLHITVDGAPWHWLDASGEPISLRGLPPGPHKVLLELESANHKVLDSETINFAIPGEGEGTTPTPVAMQAMGSNSGTNPDFGKAMMESMSKMDKGMMEAKMTGDPDHDFAVMMIPHHQGAVDMAKIYLLHGKDPVLRKLAAEIIVAQAQETKVMQSRLKAGTGSAASTH